MRKRGVFYQIFVDILVCNVISAAGITNSRDKDVLNLNGVQGGDTRDKASEKMGAETLEKRSFFKPDVDRRGSFFPSGGHGSPGFNIGTGITVGNTGYGPTYHTSGNGYSYGAPSPGNPPVIYGGHIPTPSGPSSSGGGGFPTSFGHSGGGPLGGGGFGLIPSGHAGGGGFTLTHGGMAPGGDGGFNKAMALKRLLIPIASVALLGAAAVLAKSNPVLLQLGVISGKKKRSILGENLYPVNPFVRPEYRRI